MSQLTLIRHGQAAAFTNDSDRLTELGRKQARKLGEYMLARGVRFDEVHSGTLRRQVETEQIVGEVLRAGGVAWPEARRAPGWNEYDAGAINGRLGPLLAERDPTYRQLVTDFQTRAQARDRNRYFQRMFEALMDCWVQGALEDEAVESFRAFHRRIATARSEILEAEGSRKVAVFTSGGPIGVCVQLALEAPEAMALRLNWRVKNGSLTDFTFSGSARLSLDSFNDIAHLDDPALQSFR
jgi:broad specificity phosphatase PhoE